ncbi:MAG: SgcJ/EcaC family oxidoreductase [Phycisphaerales bacterium]
MLTRLSSLIALSLIIVSVALLFGAASPRADDPQADQRAAIAKVAEAFVAAFERGDAKALSEFWLPDGDYIDLSGRLLKGRQAIADDFAHLFSESKGLKVRIEVASLQFPAPDVAIEDGVSSVLSPDGGLPNRARYTNVLVKKDGRWLLSSVRESAFTPPSNYEKLRSLEWLIGEWVDEADSAHVARVAFEWTPDQNFIIGSRAVVVQNSILDNGSQRIGWDPALKLIRSWSFEADGGFGEGTWTRDGNTWTIRSSSVLRSGSLLTSTSIITRVDPDTVTWQMKDQQVDGKALPDSAVVRMRRVG